MAISSPGVGSGLDINSIVTQLTAVEKQPLKQLQTRASKLQTQLSSFGTVKSQLASLQDASQALLSADTWGAKTFASSNTAAVTGLAGTAALASSFKVKVANLASVQTLRTEVISSTSTIESLGGVAGQISITKGGVTTPVDVALTDTLTTIATNINAKTAASGVTAVVVTSEDGQRLLMSGTKTGEDNAFSVVDSTNTNKFKYDLADAANSTMTRSQTAKDATVYLDPTNQNDEANDYGGIKITSSTNTVSDAVPGITLKLLSTTSSDTQITVGTDTDTIKAKIQAFQDTYNSLVGNLKNLTKYDAATKTAGPLQGDGTATGLLSLLNSMIGAEGPTASAATFSRLSDVGLQVQQGGQLSTNATKLNTALNSLDSLKTFFYNYGGATATNGLARRFRDFAMGANGVQGTLSLKNKSIQSSIDRNTSDQDKMSTKIDEYQKRLYKQYSSLDSKMGNLNGLSSFVTTQVAQWNKSS